jgi:exodeoxyribonuclease X
MKAIIFDTETTGIDDPALVESAALFLESFDHILSGEGVGECRRYNPGKPISYGAMATHNIMDEDVADKPPASEFRLPYGYSYLIGHNVDFDWKAIGQPDMKRICTLAMSRKTWPELDSHSQGAVGYFLYRKINDRKTKWSLISNLEDSHSAASDVAVCLVILQELVKHHGFTGFEDLHSFSEIARIPDIMTFGKHKGMRIKDLPWDYKQWLLRQPDMDPYLIKAVRVEAA